MHPPSNLFENPLFFLLLLGHNKKRRRNHLVFARVYQLQMNDNTLYATVSLSIYQAYTAMETQRMKNQAYPIIQ